MVDFFLSERCLSYDDKPLLLFQKLKDAKKNPVFMLKHIKDIRSPIVVAQQKHAARKAAENSSSATKPSPGHNRSQSRPTKLYRWWYPAPFKHRLERGRMASSRYPFSLD